MLKTRVIPTLLTNGYGLVKGEKFDSWRSVGSLVPALRVFNSRDVDELVILDIAARQEARSCDIDIAREAARHCRAPLTIGGGVSGPEDVASLLEQGADKVVLNSSALQDPSIIDTSAALFGSQCLVLSIDARITKSGYICTSHNGSGAVDRSPVSWAREAEARGIGELLLTSVDRDGTLTGYDLDLLADVADAVRVPVIAAGGAGSYQDLLRAVVEGGASAVAAGAMFQFTEQTPDEAREFLSVNGVPVRKAVGSLRSP